MLCVYDCVNVCTCPWRDGQTVLSSLTAQGKKLFFSLVVRKEINLWHHPKGSKRGGVQGGQISNYAGFLVPTSRQKVLLNFWQLGADDVYYHLSNSPQGLHLLGGDTYCGIWQKISISKLLRIW